MDNEVIQLGKDRHGYSYYSKGLHVYQIAPSGVLVGWMCSLSAWERALHKLVQP